MQRRASPLRRVVAASLVGTAIEWYDFFLYGTAAALVFNRLFFPQSEPLVGTMLAFGTYALGFVARPIGGVVFGHFGDRIGRKQLLLTSLVLMGVATFAIGLLPTHAQIGTWAPVLLILLRLVQGFAVGGEWGGAVLLVAEHAPASQRGFWASWPQVGVPIGNLLAAALLALMAGLQDEATFFDWGWRVPFLLSAVLIVIGYWVRVAVEESPVFVAAPRSARAPAIEAVRCCRPQLLAGMGLRLAENIAYYIITAFSITYMTEVAGLGRSVALQGVLLACVVHAVALPGWAALSDRIGRRRVYLVGALGSGVWVFAIFPLLDSGSAAAIVLALGVGLVFHGAMYGPQAAFIAELFPTPVRYSGASIAYQVTSIFAGSLAPIIALALLRESGTAMPVAIYVAAACCITAIAATMTRETRGRTFDEIDAADGDRRR